MAAIKPAMGAGKFLHLDDTALLRQCDVDRFRSSGPGGQKRNKTSSGVRLRHQPSGVTVTATEERSQHVNKARAVRRLREGIALSVRSPIMLEDYRPTETMASCIDATGRLALNRRDARYPLVIAELLDVLVAGDMRLSEAGKLLGVSTGHLVAFIERDPKLWRCVNLLRAERGVRPLRQSD